MIGSLLVRGLLVGLGAGLLAFVVAFTLGEPPLQDAIAFEELAAQRSGTPAEADVVARGVQRTVGLLLGNVVLGVALGGMLALAFAYAYGRVGALGARPTAALLALTAFATLTLIPFLKYPANPPAVGSAETIGVRTLLHFVMIAVAGLALLAAARLRAALRPRLDPWNAALVAGAALLVIVGFAQVVLPSYDETPAGFPAGVLYRFRLASLGVNLTLWTALGLGFGAAAQRHLARAPVRVDVLAAPRP